MNWYKSLDIHTRINAKAEAFELLCGFEFEKLACLFSLKERIEIMYNKLVLEGIIKE